MNLKPIRTQLAIRHSPFATHLIGSWQLAVGNYQITKLPNYQITTFLLLFITFLSVSALSTYVYSVSTKYTMKIGSLVPPQSVWGKAVTEMIKTIREKSGGEIDVQHFHSGMLGSEESMLGQVLTGGIQGVGLSSTALTSVLPEIRILDLPFLFENKEEAYYLIDNVIAPVMRKKLIQKGLIPSAFMENGFLQIVAKKPIHTPSDMKDLKIGSWQSSVHIAFWKAIGAVTVTPLPITEVFGAYARGMVDSGSNSINAVLAYDSLFGTLLKRNEMHITLTNQQYQAGLLVTSAKYWNTLSPEMKKLIEEQTTRLTSIIRENLAKEEPKALKKLKSLGYNIIDITPEEKDVFKKRCEEVYKKFEDSIGKDFLKQVLKEREKYRKAHK